MIKKIIAGLALFALIPVLVASLPMPSSSHKGLLGHPFGTLMTAKGIIIEGTSKADEDRVLMKVETVNDISLASPIVLPLSFFSFTAMTPPTPGSQIQYVGYETGGYQGIPSEAFQYIPRVATTDFHFASYFQVCKIR